MARIRADYVFGTTTASLTASDTTLASAGLANLPAVTGSDIAAVTLYDGTNYEIVHVTASAAGATSRPILRGQEGSTAQAWGSGTDWNHGATADDFTTSGATTTAATAPLEIAAPLVDYDPTGTAVTVDSTTASHVSFPFTCTLRSGKHLVQYRTGTDHGWVSDGVVRLKSSTDNGATWSAAWTMVDNAGEDDNGGGLVQLRDGTVVGLIVRRPTATQSGWYTQAVTSTDDGATWGTAVTLNAGASGFEYGTHLVALDNGDVLAFLYCNNGGDDYVAVMASTDSGATWTSRATITGAAGTDYQEPQAVVMPDGEILAFLRTEVGAGPTRSLSMSRSTDNGVTWATPTVILTNAGGQPAPHLTPNGLLVLAYRDHNAAAMAWRWATSADRGNTWTTRGNFEATDNVMVYGGWLDLTDGDQGLVYANELLSDTTVSDTYFMRFGRVLDATVPLGQLDPAAGANGDVVTKVGGVWTAQAPTAPGGGTSAVVSTASATVTGASVNVSLTSSFGLIHTSAVASVTAAAGDVVHVTASYHWAGIGTVNAYNDLAIWNAGTSTLIRRRRTGVNYGHYTIGGQDRGVVLSAYFVIQAADIVSGQVSFAPVARTDTSGSRQLSTSDYGLTLDVVNFG